MIAKIEKRLNGMDVIYEFVECENIEDVKEKYKNNIEYIGEILRPAQIKNINIYGNTIISSTMLKKLGNEKILNEVKRITGFDCEINVKLGGSVILIRC